MTTTNKITFGELSLNDSLNVVTLQNDRNLTKYLDIDKVNNIFDFNGTVKIGSNFNKIILSKEKGVYVPNCAQLTNSGGYIANGKISWDGNKIFFNKDMIPLSAIVYSDLEKYMATTVNGLKGPEGEKGMQGERGIRGDDGFTFITLLDSFSFVTDQSNMCLYDTRIEIPIRVLRGRNYCKLNISKIDTPYGFNINVSNYGQESVIFIDIVAGAIIEDMLGNIKFEMIVDEYYTFEKAITWNKLIQNNNDKIIERVIESKPEPMAVNVDLPKQEPMVILYGGGVFIETPNGDIFPSSIELYTKTIGISSVPRWYYKYEDTWLPLLDNLGKTTLVIRNDDPVLLNNNHISYKVEYDNGEFATISTTLVRLPKKDTVSPSKEIVNVNTIEKVDYNHIFINPKNINDSYIDIGGEMKHPNKDNTVINFDNIKSYSDFFTDIYNKNLHIASDRISIDDFPLTSKLNKGEKYYLYAELEMDLMSQNFDSDIDYVISSNIISNNEIVKSESYNGSIHVKGRQTKTLNMFIPFVAHDKTIRLGLNIDLKSHQTGKRIDVLYKISNIKIESNYQSFILGGFGMQYIKNKNNYCCVCNMEDGLVFNFKSTSKKNSILSAKAYGSVNNLGIETIGGSEEDRIRGAWSSTKDGFIFRFTFDYDTSKKYLIEIINTSPTLFGYTINKMNKYAEVVIHNTTTQPTFDFIIYDFI